MKTFFKTQSIARGFLAFLTLTTFAFAEDTHFKVTITGGVLDGKTLTGKMTEKNATSVGLQEEDKVSALSFKRVKVTDSSQHATLRINWKGAATDGKKEPSFDKFKRTGSLLVIDENPEASFHQVTIDFKALDLTLKKTSDWKLLPNGFQQAKELSGEGVVMKSKQIVVKKGTQAAHSITEDVTLTFSFAAKVSRFKQ